MSLSLFNRGSPCLNLQRENPLQDCPLSPQGTRGADREKQINREYTPFNNILWKLWDNCTCCIYEKFEWVLLLFRKEKVIDLPRSLNPHFLTMIVTLRFMRLEKLFIRVHVFRKESSCKPSKSGCTSMFHQFLASDIQCEGTVINNLYKARLILCQQYIADICWYEISEEYWLYHISLIWLWG